MAQASGFNLRLTCELSRCEDARGFGLWRFHVCAYSGRQTRSGELQHDSVGRCNSPLPAAGLQRPVKLPSHYRIRFPWWVVVSFSGTGTATAGFEKLRT